MDSLGKIQIQLPAQIIRNVERDFFEYIYQGQVTEEIIKKILDLLETKLEHNVERKVIRKRIFYVLVECLQNIIRHQDLHKNYKHKNKGLVVIQKKKNAFYITTSNIVLNSRISDISNRLDKIKQLESDALEKRYQDQLEFGEVSPKGGAGLGFLSMARKASKFVHAYSAVDDEYSYFYFRTIIPFTRNTEYLLDWNTEYQDLMKTVQLHKQLHNGNILLNFNGDFDQKNLENLLPIVEEQMKSNGHEQIYQIFFVMNKMLINIVKYAMFFDYTKTNANDRPGVFLLGFKENKYVLTAGNYIESKYKDILEKKISFVNKLSFEMLEDFNEYLINFFEADEINKPDSSIIQMRLISKSKLSYHFEQVDDKTYFFTVQSSIS